MRWFRTDTEAAAKTASVQNLMHSAPGRLSSFPRKRESRDFSLLLPDYVRSKLRVLAFAGTMIYANQQGICSIALASGVKRVQSSRDGNLLSRPLGRCMSGGTDILLLSHHLY